MKFNSLTVRVWLITMLIIAFCFVTTTQVYGYIYRTSVEEQYLADFKESIENVESYLESDPHFLLENLDKLRIYNSHLTIGLVYGEKSILTDNRLLEATPSENYGEFISKEPELLEAIENGEDTRLVGVMEFSEGIEAPYFFSLKNFSVDGQNGTMYAFGDLAFLNGTRRQMNQWTIVIFVVYVLLAALFFHYLLNRIGKPLNELRTIAFDYAKNDFSKQARVRYKDELSQLALAMNKMGKSLETTGTATRQEKELLENIVTSISTGILYFGQDKTLLMSNPSGDEFLQNWQNTMGTEQISIPHVIEEKMNQVMHHPEVISYESSINDFYYYVTIIPLFDEGLENVRGMVVSLHDVTTERRLDKMRIDFINNVSHELRTPLVMIQGYSEVIVDDIAETTEEKHEMAKIIGEEAKRMNRLVNEMLDLSRMEAGFISLVKEDVHLPTFLSSVLARFSTMAENVNVSLGMEIGPNINDYFMDRDKMSQVFVNLINNAIRHTSISGKTDGQVKIIAKLDRLVDEVLLEVKDNGTGIPEEDIPFVFDRFYKADKSRVVQKENKTGTGIGLSIVKNIIEAHGGYVEVQSVLNEGTSFIVHLPYVELEE